MSGNDDETPRRLLDHKWPAGFDKEGRRLLAECPEFRLYELYKEGGPNILERSEAIENARKRFMFGVSDKGDTEGREKRIAWAEALQALAAMSQGTYYGGLPLLNRLADTIGSEIAAMLSNPKATTAGCSAAFRTALDSLRRPSLKCEYLLILHAEGYFKGFQTRPTKRKLIEMMERIGFVYIGKNARATWREKFILAGLEGLPD